MSSPYTIKLFVPDGDPESLKIINKMNWTGIGLEISRSSWSIHRKRTELEQAGIYILLGYQEGDDLPTIYVGQGDGVRSRIDQHEKNKAFWDKVFVFVSSNGGLNRAHITWIEWALIQHGQGARRSNMNNNATPTEPVLTESEKADTKEFLNEIMSILPLVEVRVFERPKKIHVSVDEKIQNSGVQDTIVVPAQEDGFNNVFITEKRWYAIRIGGGKLKDIKYIAAYQSAPISAVTHVAEVESIEPYGDDGKYQLNFSGPAKKIRPIKFGNAKRGTLQGPTYTSRDRLEVASEVTELFD